MTLYTGDMPSINVILAAAPAGIARPQVAGLVGARYMGDPEAPPGDYAALALGMPVVAHPGPAAVTAAVIRQRGGPWAPACGQPWVILTRSQNAFPARDGCRFFSHRTGPSRWPWSTENHKPALSTQTLHFTGLVNVCVRLPKARLSKRRRRRSGVPIMIAQR